MKPARKLALRKETVIELGGQDLRLVVGASGPSCRPELCPTACTSCASDFQQCFTGACLDSVLDCPMTGKTAC